MTEIKQRPTLDELIKDNPIKCRCCGVILECTFQDWSERKINKLIDVDGEKIKGLYCGNCVSKAHDDLMDSRFVEEYGGNRIYHKDGMYFPFWTSPYHLKSIEDCRLWIDYRLNYFKER